MPGWPISCQYEGQQPQWKMTKPQKSLAWMSMIKWSSLRIQRLWMPFLLMSYPWRQRRLIWGSALTSWPKYYELKMTFYLRASPCKMYTLRWEKVTRMQLWWWGIVWPTPKLSRRKPQWPEQWPQLWCQNCQLRSGCQRGDEPEGPHTPKLTARHRQGKLFKELDLSGLESWPPELADSSKWFLAEYHNVFSLEPTELGCTHSTKHVIKVTDDTPFKEWFRWFPPTLVEEVCNHLWEMLDRGAIWHS